MGKLEGKIAVVTGGNSGIGLAAAEAFVVEGAHVFVMGRRQAELDAAVAHIGSNATAVQGDVSKPEDLDRLYSQVKHEKGKIDVLFANAGIGPRPAWAKSLTSTLTICCRSTSRACFLRFRRRFQCSPPERPSF